MRKLMIAKSALTHTAARVRYFCRSIGWKSLTAHRHGPGAAVVMFHIGRCGSSVLGDLLSQHRQIRWDGELFERVGLQAQPIGLARLVDAMKMTSKPLYGCEIKFLAAQHRSVIGLNLPQLVQQLEAVGVQHFIVLKRRNHLRRMISHVVAHKTRRYRQTRKNATLNQIVLDLRFITIKSDTKPLLEWFDVFDEEYDRLCELLAGKHTQHIVYERDILGSALTAYERTCSFLGIEHAIVKLRLQRMNPFPIRDIVINYDELARCLEGTKYAWMLD